jgi:hypothetical protein
MGPTWLWQLAARGGDGPRRVLGYGSRERGGLVAVAGSVADMPIAD